MDGWSEGFTPQEVESATEYIRRPKTQACSTCGTDREIWRESENGPSIHVTEGGGIGINVGGHVIVLPVREWFGVVAKTRTFALPVPAPAEPVAGETLQQESETLEEWEERYGE